MKSIIWCLPLLLALTACADPGQPFEATEEASSPFGFVQVNAATPSSGTSVSVKLKKVVTAGDAIVLALGWNDATATIRSVADTLGNTFTVAAPVFRNATAPNSQVMYFAPNSKAGTDTVTVTLSARVSFPDLRVAEYAGVLAVDGYASASGTSTTATVGPMTTTAAPEVLVAAGTTNGGFFAAGTGYALRLITSPDENLVEDETVSAPGSYSATATDDGSPWTLQVVALRGPAADGGIDGGAEAGQDGGADALADAAANQGSDAPPDVADGPMDAGGDVLDAGALDAGDATVDGGGDATVDAGGDAAPDVGPDVDATVLAPTLVQHVSSSVNPLGQGETGNAFRFTLPNAVGAGNALILGVSYGFSASRTVSVTDSNGNAWPAPAVSTTDGANMTSAIYVLPNANLGVTTVTVTFDHPLEPFQYTLSEFAGVGGVDAVSIARSSSPGVTAGSLSAPAGDLVWAYACDIDTGGTHQATDIAAGAGLTLLDADIAWPAQGVPHASEWGIAAGASSPGFSVTQSGGDGWLGLAVALAPSGGGTLPGAGIRIVRVNHNTAETPTSPWTVQLPSVGNLLVVSTADWAGLLDITSITDTKANTWTKAAFSDGSPQVWYAANATPSADLKVTMHIAGGTVGASLQLWDIVGAAASPFDTMTGIDLTNDVGGANLDATPSITPTTANGLSIAVLALGQGPSSGLDVGSPAGAIFDFVMYAGETDFDTMDNADGTAHVYNADTSPESWDWVIANGHSTTEYSATAVHFMGAL